MSTPAERTLKIEADAEKWNGPPKSKIRLRGYWLERAGFKPGQRVQVACIAPGVIELRSQNELILNDAPLPRDDPF